MPTFQFTAPDGKKYKVTGENAEGAYSALQQSLGGASEQQPSQLDDYYSSGIYSGEYNPLGQIARSLDAGQRGVADMLTFGTADEIQGAMLGGNLDEVRARNQELAASNPYANFAGQVAGGVGGARAVGGAATAIGNAVPAIGNFAASLAPAAGTLAGSVVRGAGSGAALGGLYGYGSGEDGAGNRATNAAVNAGIGGVFGAAVPVVAQGVSSAYRNIADRLARGAAAKATGVSPDVAAQLAQTLDADGTLGAQGVANMARAGGEAMVADAGPNAQGILDTVIQRGGPGATLARTRIAERVGRDTTAVNNALDNSLGVPEGVGAAQTNIRNAARQAVSEAYDGPTGAYAQPIDYASEAGRRVESVINRIPPRIANKAINSANERMIYDQMPNQQIMANIADDGTITFREMPNVRQADAIKRALNDIADEGTDDFGKMTPDAQFASRMARDLRDSVRDAVPEYRTALETAADPLSRQSAVELGAKLLSPSMTRDRLAASVQRFNTAPERDALAQGVRSHIDDIMANMKRTIQNGDTDSIEAYKAIKDLSSRANREKLVTALGEERVRPLLDELDRAAQSFQLQGRAANGSLTFARTQTNKGIEDMTAPGAIATAAGGRPLGAVQKIAQYLTNQTPEAVQGRQNEITAQIADFLTRPASQAIPDFQAMRNFQGQTLANQVRADTIAQLLSGARPAAYPVAAQSRERLR